MEPTVATYDSLRRQRGLTLQALANLTHRPIEQIILVVKGGQPPDQELQDDLDYLLLPRSIDGLDHLLLAPSQPCITN